MCNQFKLPNLQKINNYLIQGLGLPLTTPNFTFDEKDIFPGQTAPVLLYQKNQLQLQEKTWGYPSPVDHKKRIFNARIERFYDAKPSMWDQSFARQRCIIIASEFFEYSKESYQTPKGKYHEKYRFFDPNHPLTLIAGIYDQDNFSMVTTSPNKIMKPIHDRMPLTISPDELRKWLFQNFTDLVDRSSFLLESAKLAHKN